MFSRSVLNALNELATSDGHDPRLENHYRRLGPFMRGHLQNWRPIGSINENPIPRYLQLREAMSVVRDPGFYLREHPYNYPALLTRWSQKYPDCHGDRASLCWRITWGVSVFSSMPEDELDLFCGLLFASSLLAMVRFHYGTGEHLDSDDRFWAPAFVTFDENLEPCIRPVWGILSSNIRVICPMELPALIQARARKEGRLVNTDVFELGTKLLIGACEQQALEHDRPGQAAARLSVESVSTLTTLFKKEARRRIDPLRH